MRRVIRAIQAAARGFAVVQLAIVFGVAYILLAPPLTLIRVLRRAPVGWRPVIEDASAEGFRHGS